MIVKAGIRRLTALGLLLASVPAVAQDSATSCAHHVGQWLDPDSGEVLESGAIFDRLARSRIVLLGEAHTSAAHHRWQAYMLAALHSRNANMMVGFEMFPRRTQPVLEDWSAGKLDEEAFLRQVEWRKVWGYDEKYYLPLFHFTRLNRLPTLALNVDRELISKVGDQGWQALDEADRMGISDPAPASDAYRDALAQLYAYKQTMGMSQAHGEGAEAPDIDEIRQSEDFAHFVDAQLTWDRAMAEALAAAHRRDTGAMVVGIVGRGHLEYGYGIPHQLADMGIDDVDVLIPVDADGSCDPLPPGLASAVFVVDADGAGANAPRPRLGVVIETADAGVEVIDVVEGSVAARTGVRKGDVIIRAAGFDTMTSGELIEIVQRQAPGTWLPLRVQRGKRTLDLVAKFPQSFE